MRRAFAFAVPLFVLTACEPTVEGYVKDAEAREAKLRECANMGVIAAKDEPTCKMAMEAQSIVLKKSAKDLMNAITLQSSEEE